MTEYDENAAYHIIAPYFALLRSLLPKDEQGLDWTATAARMHGLTSEETWRAYADALDELSSLVRSYGHETPMPHLAIDWLIDCQTVSDPQQ